MMPTIGILGGMGPRATVRFEQLLIERMDGSDQELPTIITINDGSIPDRSSFLMGGGADPVPRLQRNLELLEYAGASIIGMPCNTACSARILGRLRPRTTTTIVNLPLETVRSMRRDGADRAFILGTAGTLATRLYQDACEQNGIMYTLPTLRLQDKVDRLIAKIKRNELADTEPLAAAIRCAILRSGCSSAILGCTELPLMSEILTPARCRSIDTLAVLAEACARYSKDTIRSGVPT